jgi:hypothetical protein
MATKIAKTSAAASPDVLKVGPPLPPPPSMPSSFPNKRSSGLYSAPKEAKAIDWAVINGNFSVAHWIRITVYKCQAGSAKVAIAGPTAVFLSATFTTHLTVQLTAAIKSDYYEVVIEDEDLNMHPSVQLFCKYPAEPIAGTLIPPGDFVQTQS